ncbi:MAG TPA: energy transducer TonB [Vicinamibacteria bacterium]
MHRLFSDLVLSRDGGTARRAPLAFPASLVLHAAATTVVVFASVLTREALPPVDTPPLHIPGFVTRPRAAGGGTVTPVMRPRPPRRTPPTSTAFVPDQPFRVELEALDVADIEGTGPIGGPPCLTGCDRGGAPGGDPDGVVLGTGFPSPPASVPIRTGDDIHPPLKVRNVVPVYPEIARAAHVQGDVVLDCTISNEGRVVDIKILGGHVLLQPAAVDAVRQWLYRPTLLNGVPVPVVMTVTVHFALDPRR